MSPDQYVPVSLEIDIHFPGKIFLGKIFFTCMGERGRRRTVCFRDFDMVEESRNPISVKR